MLRVGLVTPVAANRPEILLDPALLRAGRSTARCWSDRPDRDGRIEHLESARAAYPA